MFDEYYRRYSEEFFRTLQSLEFSCVKAMMERLEQARQNDRQVFIIGNGGSASSASHWACDFGKGVNVQGAKRFRVFSLADNVAWLSALGNDLCYQDIFIEPMKNLLCPNDLVIGLSVSGNSENVVRALQFAKQNGAATLALIGDYGGKMSDIADLTLVIPSKDYGVVEDTHMFVNHVISQYLRTQYQAEAEAAAAQ